MFDVPDALVVAARRNANGLLHDTVQVYRPTRMDVDPLGGIVWEDVLIGEMDAHFGPAVEITDITPGQTKPTITSHMDFRYDADIRTDDVIVHGVDRYKVIDVRGITHAAVYTVATVVKESK